MNALVTQSKNCPFGHNTTIDLKNMTVMESSGVLIKVFSPTDAQLDSLQKNVNFTLTLILLTWRI
jgi:hypothetical protein